MKLIETKPRNEVGAAVGIGCAYMGGMPDVNAHVARVDDGGGEGYDNTFLTAFYRFLLGESLLSDSQLIWTPDAGYVVREDGVLKYIRTGFDLSNNDNDLDGSATASQQPRLVGGIAPGSHPAASNQSGESRKFTHPTRTVTGTYTTVKMLDTSGKYAFTYAEVTTGSLSEVTWTGNMRFYMIYAGTLSAGQRTAIEGYLTTRFELIESVTIGSQTWASRNFEAVATPAGNVIANVTANGAVEKVVNGGFDTDTDWTKGIGWSIGSGTANANCATSINLSQTISLTVGKWYKVALTVSNYTSGGVRVIINNTVVVATISENKTSQAYFKYAANNSFLINTQGTTVLSVDNVSVQELNWSNATEIYDAVYAATSGTAQQKEYAALKEAAMWCYYNNSADNGAIYGKLYNWYAAKLLDLDMQTAGFGWRVPTSAQFTTLANALGGTSVAGGKMKIAGTSYWNSPNTGADNSSGFTALGGGLRTNAGVFATLKTRGVFWIDLNSIFRLANDDASGVISTQAETWGYSLRLIKTT